MTITLTFWKHTLTWAVVLSAGFTLLSLPGGSGEAVAHIPAWLGLGLALGTYPAGLRVASLILPDGRRDGRAAGIMAGNAVTASAAFLVLAGFVGPALLAPAAGRDAVDPTARARTLTLVALRADIDSSVAAVDPAGSLAPTTIEAWFPVNVLAWHYFTRLSGAALPFLFAWIGILAGFWGRLIPRSDARVVHALAIGLLLLVSTYLANENSFEWIVVQAAGPVPFAGLFALVVPSLLGLGLAWPAVLMRSRLPAR